MGERPGEQEGKKRKRGGPTTTQLPQPELTSSSPSPSPIVTATQTGLNDHRVRIFQRAKQLAFPQDVGSSYNTVSSRKQYGRDSPLGGSAGLVGYHKRKLNRLLDDLLLKHRWREAAGVLSVLLRGSSTENQWKPLNSHQYWAAMEVTRQLEGLQGNDMKFRKMYQILYDKQPKDIRTRDKTQAGAVRLEQALYLMGQRHYEDAHLASRPLMDVPPYRDHAVANMIHGLILHHQWYELVTQELGQSSEKRVDSQFKSREMDLVEGVGENEELSRSNQVVQPYRAMGDLVSGPEDDLISESSAQMDQNLVDKKHQFSSSRKRQQRSALPDDGKGNMWSFYDDIDEEKEKSYIKKAEIFCTPDMDRTLFPVSLPTVSHGKIYVVPMVTTKVRGPHMNAIKHLRQALSQEPHLTVALLPLVQLLLAVADAEGAYEEIEKCCQGSDQFVPFRIKSMLLESLVPTNTDMLSRSYEDTLERDPTSVQSINGLIHLHKDGAYETHKLLEYIACHLDGSCGSMRVWWKMTDCFEELKEAEMECNKVDNLCAKDKNEPGEEFPSETLKFFLQDDTRKTWTDRGSWWPLKHFNSGCVHQELKLDGGCKRVAYKAACAAHVFGPYTDYVLKVEQVLRAWGEHHFLEMLEKHTENSFNLLACLGSCMDLKQSN